MTPLDPESTVDVVLKRHRDADPKSRPTFISRQLTCSQVLRVQRHRKEALEAADDEAAIPLLVKAAAVALIGWRNMPADNGDFDAEKLPEILSPPTFLELVFAILQAVNLSEDDVKGSSSPSGSDAVAIATVPPAGHA